MVISFFSSACPPCTMKLQGIADDASNSLMTSKLKADQASESIDFYTDLEVLEGEIPRVQVTIVIYILYIIYRVYKKHML